jgi:hypothetical protein
MSGDTSDGFFYGLQLSLTHFLGMTIGAGIAIPIVISTHSLFSKLHVEPTLKHGVLLGIYIVAVVLLGTWTYLGAFGNWAGRNGGTGMRLFVQVAGIVLVAFMGLILSLLVTLLVMHVIGSAVNDAKADDSGPPKI